MRSYETTTELTYESFIETFGKKPICALKESNKDRTKGSNMLARSIEIASTVLGTPSYKECRNKPELKGSALEESQLQLKETAVEKMSKRIRKISLRKRENKGSTREMKSSNPLQRSKSVSFLGKTSPSAFSPKLTLSRHSKTERSRPLTVPMDTSPMSKLNSEDYRGYLSAVNNDKGNTSTRYWCLLADSCLYCYTSKGEDFAADVIALGGYRIALPQSQSIIPYVISLERSGRQSYQFHADNAKSYKRWMLVLTKTLSCNKKSTRSESAKESTQRTSTPTFEKSTCNDADVAKSRAELLEMVKEQQRRLLREKQAIETLAKMSADIQLHQLHSLSTTKTVTSSTASLTHSEDYGYSSSADAIERDDRGKRSPSSRSQRSLSSTSVESMSSTSSVIEDGRNAQDVPSKFLAEIEEFRVFSQKTLERKGSKGTST